MDNPIPPDPELLLAHARFVRQTAHALLRGDDRVDDVVQDTFMAALTSGPRSPASIRAWLAGVVRNLAFTVRRRDSSRGRREAAAANRGRSLPRPEEIAEREEARRRMVSAVLSLRDPYRTAVLLRYYEDLPPREIAQILEVPVETARTRVRRGLALLREEMERGQRGRSGSWAGGVALLIPGARLEPALTGGTAAAAAGGVVVGTKLKLGVALVIVALFCVGIVQWQAGPTDHDTPALPDVVDRGPGVDAGDGDFDVADPPRGTGQTPGARGASPADTDRSRREAADATAPRMWRPGPVGTVRGEVEITSSGEPIRGVEVLLEPDVGPDTGGAGQKKIRTTTDDKGGFSFESLDPGKYRITFLHPRYAHRSLTGVRVDAKGGIQGLVAVLSSDPDTFGSVEGRATGPDRMPLANRVVVVHAHEPAVWVETVTDESGEYRVDRLLGGHYFISLLGESEPNPRPAAKDSMDLWKRFVVAEIRPRETTRTDFIGYGALTGVVVDSEDRPMPGLTIQISPVVRESGIVVKKGETDPEGRFRIENAGLGAHHVRVKHMKEGWTITADTLALTGNDQETRIRLASGVIEGSVLLAEEKVPPSTKRLYPTVLLSPPDPDREGAWGPHVALAYPDWKGKLRIRGVRPGRYRLRVVLKGYVTWEKIVELEPGRSLSGIEIALRKLRMGTLKVKVRDPEGKPVDGLFLHYGTPGGEYRSLWPERPEPGVYIDRKVEVGEWTVVAARSGLKSAGAKVRITEGEVTKVQMTVEPE